MTVWAPFYFAKQIDVSVDVADPNLGGHDKFKTAFTLSRLILQAR